MKNQTLWILAAALAMPAVAATGQQNGMANSDGSNRMSQPSQDGNHAMQTGSPNDNGAGLRGNYGSSQPGTRVNGKHSHHRRSKKHAHKRQSKRTGSGGMQPSDGTNVARPH